MIDEKIPIRTEDDHILEVEVLSKRADIIWILLGEGAQSLRCKLEPTRNGLAYVGSIMGREVVYERSIDQVKADIGKQRQSDHVYRKPVRK